MVTKVRPSPAESTADAPGGSWSDLLWVLPALVAGSLVHALYLLTHPYPAFGAGLFFLMSEQVSQHGYRLPSTIPYYAETVPFAYPPLMFYVVAVLRDLTGVGPIAVSRLLPGLVTTAYLVPFYLFVRELLGSNRTAGVAAFVLALSPPVLQWHLSAGGLVRAPATLFLVTGLYTGVRLFRTGRPTWLVSSLGLFGLTLLTHPTYALFFAASYLWMYLALDRTVDGLRDGAVVGVGGLALTAPWWGQVVATHGPAVFTGAAGTHGGIGSGSPERAVAFIQGGVGTVSPGLVPGVRSAAVFGVPPEIVDLGAIGLLALLGWVGLVLGAVASRVTVGELRSSRITVFLLGWFVLSVVVVAQKRFVFLVGAVLAAIAIIEYVLPALTRLDAVAVERRSLELAVLLVIGVSCLGVGGAYATGHLDSHAGSPSLPAFIDDEDVDAMEWVASNTTPSDRFVVLGDAAEWFPALTHREILVGPWGIEWKGHASYERQLGQYVDLSTCSSGDCLTRELDRSGVRPDYLYVPKDEYTVRGMERTAPDGMRYDLIRSPDYTLVYENDGVMIFRATDGPSGSSPVDAKWGGERDDAAATPSGANGSSPPVEASLLMTAVTWRPSPVDGGRRVGGPTATEPAETDETRTTMTPNDSDGGRNDD